jgi:uncharacterized protein (DUF433 family)
MSMVFAAEAPPFREDEKGGVRVGGSRVLVELVLRAFQEGATPEAIAQRYPTTTLTDIYGVIAYYLRHRAEMEAYLTTRERQSQEVRERIEAQQRDTAALRQRLLARQPAVTV